jgi:hypothetical protein
LGFPLLQKLAGKLEPVKVNGPLPIQNTDCPLAGVIGDGIGLPWSFKSTVVPFVSQESIALVRFVATTSTIGFPGGGSTPGEGAIPIRFAKSTFTAFA